MTWDRVPSHVNTVLAIDVQGSRVVTASADHGLRVYNGQNGMFDRELFGKEAGHTEWVTSCAWCPDGKILSGGMDARVCHWMKAGKNCRFLMGHSASVSRVAVDDSNMAVTCGYDGLTLMWNLNSNSTSPVAVYGGNVKQPVTTFGWAGSLLLTAHRSGAVTFYDVNSREIVHSAPKMHNGEVSKIIFAPEGDKNLIITGGRMDGRVVVTDLRDVRRPIAATQAHGQALNALGYCSKTGVIFSGSAEGSVKVFELRKDSTLRTGIDLGVGGPVLDGKIVSEGTFAAVTQAGDLVAVNWGGDEVWRQKFNAPVTCVAASNEVLAVGAEDGQTHCILPGF